MARYLAAPVQEPHAIPGPALPEGEVADGGRTFADGGFRTLFKSIPQSSRQHWTDSIVQ